MAIDFPFDNSYARLPDRFFSKQAPTPVSDPSLIVVNKGLAAELGIDLSGESDADLAAIFAGNTLPVGATPIAQTYAAHQFGGWVPQLGDGRAVLLGEVIDTNANRRDIQLKGAGRTPYSRNGDGRSWLGPVLREYLVSEAMHALHIPTTRALAAVTSGENVQRERPYPGGIMTRVAASHIRIGTFQYFAARQDVEALDLLAKHVIERHYPHVKTPLELLNAVIESHAELIAKWVGVGFIHGVMNTDNSALSGETIDYGPCAFMDAYDPHKVFSSIDQMGRYAYDKQPQIAVWNLAQLASCLLPLMGDQTTAVEDATQAVHRFGGIYEQHHLIGFGRKIGIAKADENDAALIQSLLDIMAQNGTDFTNTFRALAEGHGDGLIEGESYNSWYKTWQDRLAGEPDPIGMMQATNPAYIARNHQVQAVIDASLEGDFAPFHRLNAILSDPFRVQDGAESYRLPPTASQEVTRTYCGT